MCGRAQERGAFLCASEKRGIVDAPGNRILSRTATESEKEGCADALPKNREGGGGNSEKSAHRPRGGLSQEREIYRRAPENLTCRDVPTDGGRIRRAAASRNAGRTPYRPKNRESRDGRIGRKLIRRAAAFKNAGCAAARPKNPGRRADPESRKLIRRGAASNNAGITSARPKNRAIGDLAGNRKLSRRAAESKNAGRSSARPNKRACRDMPQIGNSSEGHPRPRTRELHMRARDIGDAETRRKLGNPPEGRPRPRTRGVPLGVRNRESRGDQGNRRCVGTERRIGDRVAICQTNRATTGAVATYNAARPKDRERRKIPANRQWRDSGIASESPKKRRVAI